MTTKSLPLTGLLAAVLLLSPATARAHCDTMSGPVVSAARAALDSGNVNLVLVWVQPSDEGAVRGAFERARSQRTAGGQAREDADLRFFETVVRVHRAGEGAPFEGIKPANTDLGPALPAADKAIESGSSGDLTRVLNDAVSKGVQDRYQALLAKKAYDPNDLESGRAYVKSYVEYTHYVEGVYQTAVAASAHHDHHSEDAHHEHSSHHGHAAHAPWLIAGLLGIVVVGETGWLLRKKKAAR